MNNGVLCGLVSISGCAGMIDVWVSIIIGLVAGAVYVGASKMLIIFRVDDVVDAIPIHLFGGIWGTIAPALFVTKSSYLLKYPYFSAGRDVRGQGVQGALRAVHGLRELRGTYWEPTCSCCSRSCCGSASICSLTIWAIQSSMHTLRVNLNDEMKGIDASQHGGQVLHGVPDHRVHVQDEGRRAALHGDEVRAGDAAKFAMALSEVMEGSTHNSNDSAGLAMNGSSRADKNMAYAFKEVNESNRRVSASSSDGGGGSSRDQSPNRRGGLAVGNPHRDMDTGTMCAIITMG